MGEKSTFTSKNAVRIAYANIWELKKNQASGKEEYSVLLLIPKTDTDTLLQVKEAIEECYAESLDVLRGNNKTNPSLDSIHTPLRDGDADKPDNEMFKGMMFINASSKFAPKIFDAEKNDITDHDAVYSGCWCRFRIRMYAYNQSGGKGISCSLQALQKIEDDIRLDKNVKDFF